MASLLIIISWLAVATGLLSPLHSRRRRPNGPRVGPRFDKSAPSVEPAQAEEMRMPQLIDAIAKRAANELSLISTLDELREQRFCSLYSIDMLASCSYIGGSPDECSFDTCEVLSEEPPPLPLMERDSVERIFELDTWSRMDPPSEEYYDLKQYPEGYTMYNGSHIWKFMYDQLAFGDDRRGSCDSEDGWRSVFNRAISGVHACIACHIVDDLPDEDECRTEYDRRVGSHPERIANIEFVYALLLTALREARVLLLDFDYEIFSGGKEGIDAQKMRSFVASLVAEDILDDPALQKTAKLLRLSAADATECTIMSDDFSDPNADEWVEESGIWQMRQRSRAMLRVMDCIQCGVCRLHGKVVWFGVATAFRLIYGDPKSRPLQRIEVAALLTALAKLATAVRFLDSMGSLETDSSSSGDSSPSEQPKAVASSP